MPSNHHPIEPLTGLFREVVLVLGGVFAAEQTDDETVRHVADGLARVWQRVRSRKSRAAGQDLLVPHPAIAALLRATDDGERPSRQPRADRGRLRGKTSRPFRGRAVP